MAVTIKYPFGQSASIGGIQFVIVQSLPTATASTMGDIYLVPRSGSNIKDMYLTAVESGNYVWTQIGDTTIDLSDYATKEEVNEMIREVREDGFYIIDSNRNIGFMVNTSGAHSANLVEY